MAGSLCAVTATATVSSIRHVCHAAVATSDAVSVAGVTARLVLSVSLHRRCRRRLTIRLQPRPPLLASVPVSADTATAVNLSTQHTNQSSLTLAHVSDFCAPLTQSLSRLTLCQTKMQSNQPPLHTHASSVKHMTASTVGSELPLTYRCVSG